MLRLRLTLNLGQSLLEELLLESRLGELGLDVRPHRPDEVGLLGLSLLLLEPDPAVQHSLELSLDSLLLRQSEVLVLDSVGLPRDGVERFGQGHDLLERLDRGDSVLDGLLVLGLGGVELRLDSLRVSWGRTRAK